MSEDNPEITEKADKANIISRRGFLKLGAAATQALAIRSGELNYTSDREPLNIPTPEDPLCVKLVDREHVLEEKYIKEEIETELIALGQFTPEVFLRNADVTGRVRIHSLITRPLEDLLISSTIAGCDMRIRSGFRSWEEQDNIFKREGNNNNTSMPPGSSQHHTGLAIDFTTPKIGTVARQGAGVEKTREYDWLEKNAWKHGFVISYDKNHDGITNESWHWVYVGKNIAAYFQALRKNNWNGDIFDLQKAYLEKGYAGQIAPNKPLTNVKKYRLK